MRRADSERPPRIERAGGAVRGGADAAPLSRSHSPLAPLFPFPSSSVLPSLEGRKESDEQVGGRTDGRTDGVGSKGFPRSLRSVELETAAPDRVLHLPSYNFYALFMLLTVAPAPPCSF